MKLEQKKEAVRRMKLLKLLNDGRNSPVADFIENDEVWKSEFHGILYYLDKEEREIVKATELKYKKDDMKVYHCYKAHTEFGDILYMLYVSNTTKPKDFDDDLRDGITFVYAYNMSEPMFSEFGSAYVKSAFGGIIIR